MCSAPFAAVWTPGQRGSQMRVRVAQCIRRFLAQELHRLRVARLVRRVAQPDTVRRARSFRGRAVLQVCDTLVSRRADETLPGLYRGGAIERHEATSDLIRNLGSWS